MPTSCPYAVLGLTPQAEPEVVEAAIRVLRLKHHPDKGGSPDALRKIEKAVRSVRTGEPYVAERPDGRRLRGQLRAVFGRLRT
jgi:curved DNA-binding protein CbpA